MKICWINHYFLTNYYLLVFLVWNFQGILTINIPLNFKEKTFDLLNHQNSYIFKTMRKLKLHFPESIQPNLESIIKEFELKFLLNKEDFIEYVFDLFDELKEREKLDDPEFRINEEDFQLYIFDFLSEFLKDFRKLTKFEKILLLTNSIKDEFIKKIIKFGLENEFIFKNFNEGKKDAVKVFSNLIENIPNFLLKRNISLENGNFDTEELLNLFSESSPINNEESNKSNVKISKDFSLLLNKIIGHLNISEITNKRKSIKHKISSLKKQTQNLSEHEIHRFSSFLEEYLEDAVIKNEGFKQKFYQFKSKNNNMKDEGSSYTENTTKNQFSNKQEENEINLDLEEPEKIDISSDLQEAQMEMSKKAILKDDLKESLNEELDEINFSGNCSNKEKELNQILNNKLAQMQKENEQINKEMEDVPDELKELGTKNEKSKFKKILDLIEAFIKKVLKLVASHFPFYFFKICIPAGPLLIGCCPEAGFYPQQLYGVLTSFDKVNNFKLACKAYPGWLASIGHENFDKTSYYLCAQSYLTIQESSLFNMCNTQTLVYINPLNWFGLLPGDMPMCFWACLQGKIVCKTSINNFGPCDSLINVQSIMMAIFIPSSAIRLGMMFGYCTYIPFLVRWDLIPPWKKPNQQSIIDDDNKHLLALEKNKIKNNSENKEIKTSSDCIEDIIIKSKEPESSFANEYFKTEGNINEIIKNSVIKEASMVFSSKKGNSVKYCEKEDFNLDELYYFGIKNPDYVYDRKNEYETFKHLKKSNFKKNIDIQYEFTLGQKRNPDSYLDIYGGKNIPDMSCQEKKFHLINYGKEYSLKQEKLFPYHIISVKIIKK